MKRIILILSAFLAAFSAAAQSDEMLVIEVGEHSTTHILFMSDLTYVDVSMPDCIAARVVESSKNMLALKAKTSFDFFTTVSALEANGTMHTFKVRYEKFPQKLLVDTRTGGGDVKGGTFNTQVRPAEEPARKTVSEPAGGVQAGAADSESQARHSSNFSKADAPTLEEVMRRRQQIYHVGDKNYGIEVYCTNIFVYSDMTYLVLNIKNSTDIGFDAGDAQFTVENINPNAKSLATDKTVWIKSSYGSLSCAPKGESKVGYTIPKLTLMKGECLKIYIYEKSGNRNLILALTDKDINFAVSPKGR